MKIKRHLAPAAGALLLVTGAASVALLGGGTASAAGQPSSAFALELTIADNEIIPPTPQVVSTDGSLVEESAIPFPDNPLLSGGVLNASAQNGAASASTTDIKVGDGLLAQVPELPAQLSSACNQLATALDPVTGAINEQVLQALLPGLDDGLQQLADALADSPIELGALGALDITKLTTLELNGLCKVLAGDLAIVSAGTVMAECTGDAGSTTIADLEALGLPVDIDVSKANQQVKIPDVAGAPALLTLTVNRQTTNADGTFTVDALALNLLGEIDLVVSSATCGEVTQDNPDGPDRPEDAPSPTPVESHVPVTG